MLKVCRCGKEFITEADPYVVIPWSHKDVEFNCGCFFSDPKNLLKKPLEVVVDE